MIKFISLKKISCVIAAFSFFQLATIQTDAAEEKIDAWYISSGTIFALEVDDDFDAENRAGTVELDQAIGLNLSIGRKIGNVRIEGNILWVSQDISDVEYSSNTLGIPIDEFNANANSSGDVTSTTATLNAYYDIETGTALTPYLGAGIGFAFIDLDSQTEIYGRSGGADDSDTTFTVHGEIGLTYDLSEKTKFYTAYRLSHVGETEFEDNSGSMINGSSMNRSLILVGIRYEF